MRAGRAYQDVCPENIHMVWSGTGNEGSTMIHSEHSKLAGLKIRFLHISVMSCDDAQTPPLQYKEGKVSNTRWLDHKSQSYT
jgi:hypothetical protein